MNNIIDDNRFILAKQRLDAMFDELAERQKHADQMGRELEAIVNQYLEKMRTGTTRVAKSIDVKFDEYDAFLVKTIEYYKTLEKNHAK